MIEDTYESQGFAIVKQALNSESYHKLEGQFTQLVTPARQKSGLAYAHDIVDLQTMAGLVEALVTRQGLIASKIVYSEIVETVNNEDQTFPLHQDGAYFENCSISIAIAFSKLGDARGGLWTVPGSHKKGLLTHLDGDLGPTLDKDVDRLTLQPLVLEPGDAVLIHPCLIHTMVGNPTSEPARFLSVTLA